jgi:hypothetical protein
LPRDERLKVGNHNIWTNSTMGKDNFWEFMGGI